MQCRACDQRNREGARFWIGCGGRLAAGCARCGAEEGVAMGQRIGTPVYEVEAQRALARVLLRETGARNYQPFLHVERLFRQTGATPRDGSGTSGYPPRSPVNGPDSRDSITLDFGNA